MLKKIVFGLLMCPAVSLAGELNFKADGLIGAYYGVSDASEENDHPDRWVLRADTPLGAEYQFSKNHRSGVYASTTVMLREDDVNRSEGEFRFYPYFADFSNYGEVYVGYVYNVAKTLHKGAKDITFLNVDDPNSTYFLSDDNWGNGYKSTIYATPKSTSILNDGRALKLAYILPVDDSLKVGFSYTPDNANRRGMTSRYVDYDKAQDGYVSAVQKKWQLDETKVYASGGYGIFNRTDKELSLGLTVECGNFNIATGYKKAYVDGIKNPISTKSVNDNLPAYFDNYRESEAWNISMGYKWDSFKTNVAYLNTRAENTRHQDNMVMWSNVYLPIKNVELYAVGAYLGFHGSEYKNDNEGYASIFGVGYRY